MNQIFTSITRLLNPASKAASVQSDTERRLATAKAQNAALERECGQLAKQEQSMLAQLAARDRELAARDREVAALEEKLSPEAFERAVARTLAATGHPGPSMECRQATPDFASLMAEMTPGQRVVFFHKNRDAIFAEADRQKRQTFRSSAS